MRFGETAISQYGLIITDELLETLVSRLSPEYSPEDYADAPYYFSEPVVDKLGIVRLSGFTGEAFGIAPEVHEEMVYDWDSILFIPAERTVSPFYAAYDSFDELVQEVSYPVRRFLPEGFDYAEYVRHIVGTCAE